MNNNQYRYVFILDKAKVNIVAKDSAEAQKRLEESIGTGVFDSVEITQLYSAKN